jgi:acyl carrier protein
MADGKADEGGKPAGEEQAEEVVSTVKGLLKRLKKRDNIDLDTSLYAEGIGLDSLETAELSAALEDELGDDPFTSGEELPETIGDIVEYYEGKSPS